MSAVNQLGQLPTVQKKKRAEDLISNAMAPKGFGVPSQFMPDTQAVLKGSGADTQAALNAGDIPRAAGSVVRGTAAMVPAVANDILSPPINAAANAVGGFLSGLNGGPPPVAAAAGGAQLSRPQQQQATYSNEGRNYKAGMGPLQSPAISTSQPAAPPEVGSNAALALQNPAGRVTKMVDANGRVSYSGQNVSGAVSFMGADGKPLAGSPSGTYNEGFMGGGGGGARQQLAAGFGSMAGGGGGGLPLYNVGGTGYSNRENATMAANIRDGIDPMTGLNGAPQVSIMGNSGARVKSPGQAYMDQAMNAPRTLTNLTQRQRDRIADTATRMDATAQQGASDAARLGLQGQELAVRQQDAANRLAMDGQRVGMDMARFNAEQPRRDAELMSMGMKNQEVKRLMDARDAYMTAKEGSPEQRSALKQLQTLSGKFGAEPSEWDATRIKVGVDANGNPIEGIARMNKRTGEVLMPDGYQKGVAAKPSLEVGKTYPRTLADGTTVNARFMGDGKWTEVK